MNKPKCLKEVTVAENQFIKVNMDIVEFNKRVQGTHIKVSPKNGGGVILFIKNQNNEVYLHHAYHYASNGMFLEFIRGFIDYGENAIKSAKRELEEEITFNYKLISEPIYMGKIYSNSTIISSYDSLYYCEIEITNKLDKHKDSMEYIESGSFYSLDKLNKLIANGTITDGYTLASYAILKAKGII